MLESSWRQKSAASFSLSLLRRFTISMSVYYVGSADEPEVEVGEGGYGCVTMAQLHRGPSSAPDWGILQASCTR